MAEILSERRRVTFALPETAARDAADGELAAAIENLGIELDAAASAAFDDREAAPSAESVDVSANDLLGAENGDVEQHPSHPPGKGERAPLRDGTNGQAQQPALRSREVPACLDTVPVGAPEQGVDAAGEQLEPPTVDMLKDWAAASFADVGGVRVELPTLGTAFQSTNGLLINAQDAVRQLFKQKGTPICSSPERPDLKLSQEEALGWLLAHARGRRLLDHEARAIGKVAGKQAGVAKQQCDAVGATAKTRRSKARKRGATPEEIAAIDEAAATEKAGICLKPFAIYHMPDANTTVVKRRPPRRPSPRSSAREPEPDPEQDMCPRAHAMLEMAKSTAAGHAIIAAYNAYARRNRDFFFDEDAELAQVRYKHALRRLKAEYPGEFCGFSEQSAKEVVMWTVRMHAAGFVIPAAVAASQEVGWDLELAASRRRERSGMQSTMCN